MNGASVTGIYPDWPAASRVRAFASTRAGGVSTGAFATLNIADHVGDKPAAVAANRRLLSRLAALPTEPRWLRQVHSPRVVQADAVSDVVEADAAWTDSRSVVCAVMTADCLPVLFCDRAGTCVAAAHAGWRGLASGVLELTLDRLFAAAVPATDVLVWLGPAIGVAAYEVDAPVRDALLAHNPNCESAFHAAGAGHWQLDLYAAARAALMAQGVTQIWGGDFCTFADRRFFSHRREAPCGRQVALIWLAD